MFVSYIKNKAVGFVSSSSAFSAVALRTGLILILSSSSSGSIRPAHFNLIILDLLRWKNRSSHFLRRWRNVPAQPLCVYASVLEQNLEAPPACRHKLTVQTQKLELYLYSQPSAAAAAVTLLVYCCVMFRKLQLRMWQL